MTRNLLNPACDDCDNCCIEAPTRSACQYRSGTNGETVTTRPTVAVSVSISGSGSPDCGGCSFAENYTWTCGGSTIADVLFSCDFTGTWPAGGSPDECTRTIEVLIQNLGVGGANGFRVIVTERFTYPTPNGPGTNSYPARTIQKDFTWDDFAYTDCDGDPVTDPKGSVNFVSGSQLTFTDDGAYWLEVPCDIAATISASNN